MCMAVSGRCFMSHHLFGKSANQGECIQPCRREYEVYDSAIDKSLIIGNDYVLSPKDLCTIEFIDLLIENKLDKKVKKELLAELETVYNRGFSTGFYFDTPSSENYADIYGSK